MKKLLVIIISAVMALAVCACGGGAKPAETTTATVEETTVSIKDEVIGSWSCEYTVKNEEYEASFRRNGDKLRLTMDIYKGGSGKAKNYNITQQKDLNEYSFTWEIVDDIINITTSGVNGGSYTNGYELIKKDSVKTLKRVDGEVEYIFKE